MNLFYFPGACSLASHIALAEAGMSYRLVTIDMEKRTSDGRDFRAINPKGFIPALELDDGAVLAESLAILTYIADQAGILLPREGFGRWKVLEALSFMATEVHGNFKPFWKKAPDAEKDRSRALLLRHFATLADELGGGPFLVGDRMTIADAYLFVMLLWAARHEIDVPEELRTYAAQLKHVPSVARALAEEGLT
ncbi:MAG: glutathione S-transferase N-terminal domain-containing protein [Azospirillaceae bacterium]|nr:glutathione S-transferase N-terminal domain-containing protein [Azospirillaceae bacterium]